MRSQTFRALMAVGFGIRPSSIEAELKYGRYESRLGKLEEKVFGSPRR